MTTQPTQNTPRRAVIVGGNRIPFARSNKEYSNASNQDMLTATIDGLVARYGLSGERLGSVAAGAVLKHSRDFNLARECVLGSALDPATPAYDIQQACATGMEALSSISNKIKLGQIDAGIAGGVDTTSDAPIAVNDRLRKILLEASRQKSTLDMAKVFLKVRPADLAPDAPSTGEPRTGLSMGEHQAITTAEWGVTRAEQDELAAKSHQNLARAYDEGFFDDLITPFKGVTRDTNLRADSTTEKLAKLKPVFGRGLEAEPTMTAGNSTPLTDGASAVLISSEEWAAERGLPVLADVVDVESAAVDFVHGDEGLLMAPVYATPRLLARQGLTFDDIDFFEIHEAFAGTVCSTMKAWEDEDYCREKLGLDGALGSVPREKLNVNGSSLACGHPFAATGGRITASLAKLLRAKADETGKVARGLISVCAAGGQGVVAILEARP
ncbi:acetyl-CoA C-acetyltransferase [Corynebacterium freneyi]|uniref:acetyl-CoA C-acetyltransferase n=1 Tax=Corynebacterium freneyi TaxID=134034 RepID=UPI00254DAFC1|nr:acetyl-CoA C-acetyltransferase [Corynebacterium freneyi]MDK8767380.1 acetyl-CoA C-acetyltransferase [Corynebacterium freneyi]